MFWRAAVLTAFTATSLTAGFGVWARLESSHAEAFVPALSAAPSGPSRFDGVVDALMRASLAYEQASRRASDPSERRSLRDASEQRAVFAKETRSLAAKYGFDVDPSPPAGDGFAAGALERALLEDGNAARSYDAALSMTLPYEFRAALEAGRDSVDSALAVFGRANGKDSR